MTAIRHLMGSALGTLLLAGWLGCGSNATPAEGGSHGSSSSTSLASGGGTTTGTGAGSGGPTFIAHFDKSQGQLPEGLWQAGGQPIVGWAPLASIESVAADGTAHQLGALGTASNTFTLGIVSDASGALYFGVGAAAVIGGAPPSATPVAPAPGVYMIPTGGGAAKVFSLGSAATPPMNFANGLAFQGTNLFVADSGGVVYKIDATGAAAAWSQDPLLAPSQPACAGVVPLAVGANGIVVDATDVYVTNTNYGRLVRIPIQSDGSAGVAQVIAEDCADLAGADGLAKDQDGSFLIAVNAQNRIARVAPSGAVSIVARGEPLDTPASVLIDTTGSTKRLLVTNSSFFSAADGGAPGLLMLPLP